MPFEKFETNRYPPPHEYYSLLKWSISGSYDMVNHMTTDGQPAYPEIVDISRVTSG
jgi:hypothetical protein